MFKYIMSETCYLLLFFVTMIGLYSNNYVLIPKLALSLHTLSIGQSQSSKMSDFIYSKPQIIYQSGQLPPELFPHTFYETYTSDYANSTLTPVKSCDVVVMRLQIHLFAFTFCTVLLLYLSQSQPSVQERLSRQLIPSVFVTITQHRPTAQSQ